MHAPLLRHLRRNAVAYLALFVALGGTSFAAAAVITGKNVKNGSLTGKDVKNSSLTGGDVKNESLTPKDFNGSVQGPKGDTGPQGPKGDTGARGLPGADGAARAYGYVTGAGNVNAEQSKGIAAVARIDAGLYCVWLAPSVDVSKVVAIATRPSGQSSTDVVSAAGGLCGNAERGAGIQVEVHDLADTLVDGDFSLMIP